MHRVYLVLVSLYCVSLCLSQAHGQTFIKSEIVEFENNAPDLYSVQACTNLLLALKQQGDVLSFQHDSSYSSSSMALGLEFSCGLLLEAWTSIFNQHSAIFGKENKGKKRPCLVHVELIPMKLAPEGDIVKFDVSFESQCKNDQKYESIKERRPLYNNPEELQLDWTAVLIDRFLQEKKVSPYIYAQFSSELCLGSTHELLDQGRFSTSPSLFDRDEDELLLYLNTLKQVSRILLHLRTIRLSDYRKYTYGMQIEKNLNDKDPEVRSQSRALIARLCEDQLLSKSQCSEINSWIKEYPNCEE
ncbi:MAG: hypothetical protein KDD52_05265 [Bdellovibrionales bacterium]|nr:hypothetical protein [Bdellovibrionales bacterium]